MCMMLSSAENLTLLETPTFRFLGLQSLCFNKIWFFWSVLWISPRERSADVSEPCPPETPEEVCCSFLPFLYSREGQEWDQGSVLGRKALSWSWGKLSKSPLPPDILLGSKKPLDRSGPKLAQTLAMLPGASTRYRGQRCFVLTSLPGFDWKGGGSLPGRDAVCMGQHIRTGSISVVHLWYRWNTLLPWNL